MNQRRTISKENEVEIREKMKRYWQVYKPSLESMMLSNDARYLAENEQNELLSYLPHYSGNKILELGAGIGRFTSRFAIVAGEVTAVDFMDSYIKMNEEKNRHFENITFLCADVTKLDFPDNSFDLVFSNWLLMYLSNSEVENLMKLVLKWLKPDGSFFFRESCYHQSGNVARPENPTMYRTPLDYIKMLNKASTNKNEFSLRSAKNVLTYIYYHGNPNQLCLLAEKKEKENSEVIEAENIPLNTSAMNDVPENINKIKINSIIENFSGEYSIKNACIKLGLRPGQRVLNICCEDGSIPMFLAKNFEVFVHGVDVSPLKIHYAIEQQGKLELSIRKKIQYEAADWTEADFSIESYEVILCFDIFLSKQNTINLIDKAKKWLKDNGKLVCLLFVTNQENEDFSENSQPKELLTEVELRSRLKSSSFSLQEANSESEMGLKFLKNLEIRLTKSQKGKLTREQSSDMTIQDIKTKINILEKNEAKLLKIIANK